MAKTHECTIGNLRNGTMRYITPPTFVQNFRADMNSIGATWGPVAGKGSWIFQPEHLAQVAAWARLYFPLAVVPAAHPIQIARLSDAEQFAVAMGLGMREQEDLF